MTVSRKSVPAQQDVDQRQSAAVLSSRPHPPWTFLTNHAHVLVLLYANPDSVLREVALQVGITERAVQRIVQDLEEEGFLQKQRVGRRNHYVINGEKHLRHSVESHCSVDSLLRLVSTPNSSGHLAESK